MSCDFRSHYPGPSLPPSPCQKRLPRLILVMYLLCLNDSMALAAINTSDRRYDRLGGGVIECHESVTLVHTTRMRVSRIRDNRPLSGNNKSIIVNFIGILLFGCIPVYL